VITTNATLDGDTISGPFVVDHVNPDGEISRFATGSLTGDRIGVWGLSGPAVFER
jgi:hypothetical protein